MIKLLMDSLNELIGKHAYSRIAMINNFLQRQIRLDDYAESTWAIFPWPKVTVHAFISKIASSSSCRKQFTKICRSRLDTRNFKISIVVVVS